MMIFVKTMPNNSEQIEIRMSFDKIRLIHVITKYYYLLNYITIIPRDNYFTFLCK